MNEEQKVTEETTEETTEEVVETPKEEVAEQSSSLLSKEETTEPVEAERPDWLPEKFKTIDDFTKSYSELESMIGKKEEDIRKKVEEDIISQSLRDRPETVGDYKIPEYLDSAQATDNKLLQWWSNHSYENGFSQDEFEQGIQIYVNQMRQGEPVYAEEMAKLGDNAKARIDAVNLFANKHFQGSSWDAVEQLCTTADGVMALEKMMDNMKAEPVANQTNTVSAMSEADLQAMMKDERYHNPAKRDKAFVKQVEDGYKKLYG
tara:strand:- start:5894 stop:6679 length:786 start_codon:yes stop_codon:yes gene_type:complete